MTTYMVFHRNDTTTRYVADVQADERDSGWDEVEKLHFEMLNKFGAGEIYMVATGDGRKLEFPKKKEQVRPHYEQFRSPRGVSSGPAFRSGDNDLP